VGDVIGEMVNRFLSWPLPGDVCVDAVACQKGAQHRTGTNLLTHAQARQMIEHVCAAALAAKDAEIERLRTGDTCARACEGMAFRIMYQQEKARAERAEKAEAELAALRAELAVLRNNQLGPVPDGPLKALGAWVADHTDDDTWPNAERYLNAALAEMEALRERVARLVGLLACPHIAERDTDPDWVDAETEAAVAEMRAALKDGGQ